MDGREEEASAWYAYYKPEIDLPEGSQVVWLEPKT